MGNRLRSFDLSGYYRLARCFSWSTSLQKSVVNNFLPMYAPAYWLDMLGYHKAITV